METETSKRLIVVFNSSYPIECYILKGRLETEDIDCYVFDDELVWVHPFRSVAIGGVKLKVPEGQLDKTLQVLSELQKGLLVDEKGVYELEQAIICAYEKENQALQFQKAAFHRPGVLDDVKSWSKYLRVDDFSKSEIQALKDKVNALLHYKNKRFTWNAKQFFYELFDFERDFFKYLRVKPHFYHFEKDILDRFGKTEKLEKKVKKCPNCQSENTKYGHALDYKWDIAYLLISILLTTPFYPFRKKYHCFDCGCDFR